MFNRTNKLKGAVAAMLFLFVFSGISAAFFPVPASAQFGSGFTYSYDIGLNPSQQKEKVEKTVTGYLTDAALGALLNAASYFTRKLAYDAALYVAYGGKGQGALAFQDGWGNYLENVALDSVASGIGKLGEPFGLNLCEIPNLQVQLFLQIGLHNLYAQPPKPNCNWQQLKNGGIFDTGAWEQKYGTRKGLEETFSASLSVQNSDFGIGLGAIAQLDRNQAAAREAATAERLEGRGFKSLTSLISGDVLTPAQVVETETEALTSKHQGEISAGQIAGIYGTASLQIFPQAASVFLNTLTSQLLTRLLTEGLFPDRGLSNDTSFITSPFADPNYNQTFGQARNAFSFLTTRAPGRLTDFDILPALAACPRNPGLNNCVIDSGLLQALTRARSGGAMTIREALEQGFLQRDWPLISPRHEDHNNIGGCQEGRYCYSNIQKLRKLRVLPLGFEVAALRSDPDNPWSLGTVVDNFDNCSRPNPNDKRVVAPDAAHPFCHLINPNWVITIPQAQCEAQVYGPLLAELGAPIRRQDCVDVSTCIARGPDGQCLDFGYCTKEENVWKLPGTQCDAQYSTCETFVNTRNNRVASYLGRTVDFGSCNLDNVGCRAYATEQTGDTWLASGLAKPGFKISGRNQTLFFDEAIRSVSTVCNPSNNGCTAFKPAVRNPDGSFAPGDDGGFDQDANMLVHAKKAPDYLNCYDVRPDVLNDINTIGVQWPTTIQEATNVVARNPECANFATACVADEVGCESFTPSDGGAVIPGSIGDENRCSAQCAGYDTFKQLGYQDVGQGFENEKFPLYFVPGVARLTMQQQGLTCNADTVGCDEFTNLDELARGGESLEYYSSIKYCERPADDGSNVQVFYSWEGSATEGFVLRTHRLRPLSQTDLRYITLVFAVGRPGENAEIPRNVYLDGGPAYADDSRASLMENAAACNKGSYELKISDPGNPAAAPEDCKSLYDTTGNAYYRLLGKSITVSGQCRALRKTEANVVIDEDITNLPAENIAMCQSRGGTWGQFPGANNNENVCVRCANGAEFKDGLCIYSAIAGPGESRACAPQANGCRAYTGNQAGNVFDIFAGTDEDFEPGSEDPNALLAARENWNSTGVISVVSEATDVGLHSLQVDAEKVWRSIPTSTMAFDQKRLYTVSFWARGASQNIRVSLSQPNRAIGDAFVQSVGVGNVWQRYEFGPVEIDAVDQTIPVDLNFERVNGRGVYFLDHVRLTRVQDSLYLIKNSWQIGGLDAPLACDLAPFDGLPGAALGCSEYTDSNNNLHYATGFERLCREQAIGCQPVWDTRNTVGGVSPELSHAYNVFCEGDQGTECSIELNGAVISTEPCRVEAGQTGCYVKEVIFPAGGAGFAEFGLFRPKNVTPSTIHIPADTPSQSPLFLAIGKDDLCQESARGCMLTGLEEQILPAVDQASSYEHVDAFVKNDPLLYGDTLCQSEVVGCSEFTHNSNVSYFKDPVLTGGKLCTYRPASALTDSFGWFLEGVGTCSGLSGAAVGTSCRSNADCASAAAPNGTCINMGNIACSPDFVRSGGRYDLWSNESQNYKGFVGICPGNQNLCTELIDRADTSNVNPDGQSYHVIFDDKVTSRLDDCTSVSLSEGCILLDKTDSPNKIYNTAGTYSASEGANPPYAPVQPVSNAGNDANILLKVDRGRQCSEWLACRTSVPITTPEGDIRNVCYEYDTCNQIGNDGIRCGNWLDRPNTSEEINDALLPLTYDKYVARSVSWYADELSGYSLYNSYQISDLVYQRFAFSPEIEKRLGSLAQQVFLTREIDNELIASVQNEIGEQIRTCDERENWEACGPRGGGRCYNNKCLYPIDGDFETTVRQAEANNAQRNEKGKQLASLLSELTTNSCKGTPEQDSPFPKSAADIGGADDGIREGLDGQIRNEFTTLKPGFRGANVCQSEDCSCSYNKVEYDSGVIDYWPVSQGNPPAGICQGGSKEGAPCTTSNDCPGEARPQGDETPVERGVCQQIRKLDQFIGTKGFCLQDDLSRSIGLPTQQYACLTWLPIQVSASGSDIYNNDINAGYNPQPSVDIAQAGGQVYCTQATHTVYGPYDDSQFDKNAVGNIDNYFSRFVNNNGTAKISDLEKTVILPNNNNQAVNTRVVCRYINPDQADDDGDAFGPALLEQEEPDANDPNFYAASDYVNAVCEGGQDLYQVVESIAWKKWKNAAVLRIEQHRLHPLASQESIETFGMVEVARRDGVVAERVPQVFVPHNLGRKEYGVIMHPPRIWNYDELIANDAGQFSPPYFIYSQRDALNPRPEGDSSDNEAVISPGLWGPSSPGRQGPGDRSDFERYLNKNELQKIYFLPLSVPGGMGDGEADMPQLLTDKLYIDIEKLDEEGADVRLVDEVRDESNTEFPWSVVNNRKDALVWTYKLTKGERELSLSRYAYSDYSMFSSVQRGGINAYLDGLRGGRNEIFERYVMVFSDWTKDTEPPTFVTRTVHPDEDDQPQAARPQPGDQMDPFAVECQSLGNDKSPDFFVIGLDFNDDGEFLGYISRWCNPTGADSYEDKNGLQLAVIATLKDSCTEFTQVYDRGVGQDFLQATTNKAWTNRVWSEAQNAAGNPLSLPAQGFGSIKSDTPNRPFGTLSLQDFAIRESVSSREALRRYIFDYAEPKRQGVAYGCTSPWLGAPTITGDGIDVSQAERRCAALDHPDIRLSSVRTQEQSYSAISQIFAKAFNIADIGLSMNRNTGAITESQQLLVGGFDNADTVGAAANLIPPQIYALNPWLCRTNINNCIAAEKNAFTVGNKNAELADYNGDGIIDEDLDNNGIPDPTIAVGSYLAQLKFFAFADENRMPIRSVKVDWADGSHITNENTRGLYKNRKPVCEPRNTGGESAIGLCRDLGTRVVTQLTCSSSKTCPSNHECLQGDDLSIVAKRQASFGNVPRACQEDYFQFIHEYSCSKGDIDQRRSFTREIGTFSLLEQQQIRQLSGDPNITGVCVFTPRVQVTDNWGWCNGSCNGDGNTGCYEALCSTNLDNPWTYFGNDPSGQNGRIIVIPDLD